MQKLKGQVLLWYLWASQGPKAYLWISLLSSDSVLHPLGKAAPLVSSLIRWTNCTALGPFSSIFHLLVSSQFFSNKPITKSCLRTNRYVLLLQILSPITSLGYFAAQCNPHVALRGIWCPLPKLRVYLANKFLPVSFGIVGCPVFSHLRLFRVEDLSFTDRVNKKSSE